jgi:hypothetical protein
MMKLVVITLVVPLTVFISSCSTATVSTHEQYLVTGNADGAPIGCSPQDVASRIVEMLDALNRGDTNKLVDEYFGRKEKAPFEWYSMTEFGKTDTEKNHFVAYTWEDLARYFEQRHQQHEQMKLRWVQFNAWDAGRGLVHFGPLEVTRHADDLSRGLGGSESIASGKGAYHCDTKAFVVLSLGMNMPQP